MFSRPRFVLLCAVSAVAFSLFASTGSAAAATGSIEGEVVKAGNVAVKGVEVCAFQLPSYELFACEETDTDGQYLIEGLPDGEYIVEFWASYLGYAPQFFNGFSSFEEAEAIEVSGLPVTGIDAELKEGGVIEGRVTDASTGTGIDEAEVCAYSRVIAGSCTSTNSAGDYAVIGLATGSYAVEFWAKKLGYQTLFYNQQPEAKNANFVSVTAPSTTTSIDARLTNPAESFPIPFPTHPFPTPSIPVKPKSKVVKCHKGFKKVKRHGRSVCVKKHKHKKKHHS